MILDLKTPTNLLKRIVLFFFETAYNYLKPMGEFSKTEELNIENAIFNIKKKLEEGE